MKRYLYKSNRLPMQVLGWLSPIEIRNNGLENNLQTIYKNSYYFLSKNISHHLQAAAINQ